MRTSELAKHIRNLSHSDVSRRRTAAQSLAGTDERAIYPLIKVLKDPNPGVQEAAMRSLMDIGGEVVAYMVLPLLREDSYLRNTATLILKGLGSVSVPLLYPLLADKDDDVRKFSVDLLAEIKDGVLPEMLVPLIDDPNVNVRSAAVRAVGALMYRGGVGHVVRALKDEEWVCFSALETLGELKDESAVDAITGLLSIGSDTLKVAALETLGRIGSAQAGNAIVGLIAKASGDVKSAAVKSLVQIGIPSSMPELGKDLTDMFRESDWEGKLIALKGLLALKEQGAIRLIIDTAGSLDPSLPGDEEKLRTIKEALLGFGCSGEFVKVLADPEIRYRGKAIAAETVAQLACEDAVPQLIELFHAQTRDVRRACIKALGRMDAPAARQAVKEALSDADGHIRKQAAVSLGELGGSDAFDLLLHTVKEEEFGDVMEEAVKALLLIDTRALSSRLKDFPARVREAVGRFAADMDILLVLSRDEEPDVRASALSSLGGMADRRAVDRVLEATSDSEPEIRRTAVIALGGMEFDPGEIKPLLSDGDMWIRLHAVRALGQSRRQDVFPVLEPMTADREIPVVLAAVEAMAMIGGGKARDALHSLAAHPDEAVREAALEALENF